MCVGVMCGRRVTFGYTNASHPCEPSTRPRQLRDREKLRTDPGRLTKREMSLSAFDNNIILHARISPGGFLFQINTQQFAPIAISRITYLHFRRTVAPRLFRGEQRLILSTNRRTAEESLIRSRAEKKSLRIRGRLGEASAAQ